MARASLSLIVGGFCGALSGAALLAVPTYFSRESGFLGPESSWTGFAAIMGSFYGVLPGAVIGLLAGILKANKLLGATLGGGIGLIILFLLLFAFGRDPDLDSKILSWGLASIPIGAIIGVIVSAICVRPSNSAGKA